MNPTILENPVVVYYDIFGGRGLVFLGYLPGVTGSSATDARITTNNFPLYR